MPSLRTKIRNLLLQSLFETDFRGKLDDEKFLLQVYNRLLEEEKINDKEEYGTFLLNKIVTEREKIDTLISEILDTWTIKKLTYLDRNILRIGVSEILFGEERNVPIKVAINEAIELADVFSNISSKRFINGILGSFVKVANLETKIDTAETAPDKQKRIKKSAGVLIYRVDDKKNVCFALIQDIFHKWTLPKSEIQPNEKLFDTIQRTAKKELNIDVSPEEEIGYNSYIAHPPEGAIRKEVVYFTAKTEDVELKPGDSEGIILADWFDVYSLSKLSLYKDLKQGILDTANRIDEYHKNKTG